MDAVISKSNWTSCVTLFAQPMWRLVSEKLALFHIELSKRLIPEYLRLGDTCFTHMSVFGTLNKQDGQMPLHFDERDIISCVFHWGKVSIGGATLYYNGDSAKEPGKQVYSVPFNHVTLQIGFQWSSAWNRGLGRPTMWNSSQHKKRLIEAFHKVWHSSLSFNLHTTCST